MKKFLGLLMVPLLGLFLMGGGTAGCGSSSTVDGGSDSGTGTTGGTTVEGLEIAQQMSLVTAKESSSSPSLNAPTSSGLRALTAIIQKLSAEDNISTAVDAKEIYVFDESGEFMQEFNDMLCLVGQTAYDILVNQGAYLALVEESHCDRSTNRTDENANQSGGSNASSFENWIAQSTRTDNSSPHLVTFWVTTNDDPEAGGGNIYMEVEITGGKTSTNPFGLFSASFWEYDERGAQQFKGRVDSGLTDVGFNELQMAVAGNEDEFSFNATMHTILTPGEGTDEGVALLTKSGSDGSGNTMTDSVDVAFNNDHMLARFAGTEGSRTVCKDRNLFRKNVWSYNLYRADTGALVTLNSGFPVQTSDGHWCHAGYYGIWCPDEVSITSGMTVTDEDDNSYTVQVGSGRLIKRVRESVALGDLDGDLFNLWQQETMKTLVVYWDANTEKLMATGEEECGANGCEVTPYDSEIEVALTDGEWVNLYKPGLGPLDFEVPNGGLTNEFVAFIRRESFVKPGDSDLFPGGGATATLQCVWDCPKAPVACGDLSSGDLFLPELDPDATPYLYTFDADTYTLSREGSTVDATSCTRDENSFHSWGFQSGPMVLDSIDLGGDIFGIWEDEIVAQWETGPNEWNRDVTLIDGDGNAVAFDPPLQILYEHPTLGTFRLEYGGPGELWGIPWENVGEGDKNHSAARFTLTDRTALTDSNGISYLTMAMVEEQMMEEVATSECSDLAIGNISATTLTVPDDRPEGMPTAPSVSSNPAVIQGVVQ